VVAAAGFGVAFASYGLIQRADRSFPLHQFDVGSLASINTVSGFKPCIVVDLEDDDVVCVLLEDIEVPSGLEHDHLSRHDLLLVKRIDILHPEFAECHLRPVDRLLH